MSDLVITRALPNPMGKDRTPAHLVTNEQLNGEWIEFTNDGGRRLSIDGCSIHHKTFTSACVNTGSDQVTTFKGVMEIGESIRLHTGTGEPWNEGSLWHLYVGSRNYIWNNKCGDTAELRAKDGGRIDKASYAPNQREGAVLRRVPNTEWLTETGTLTRVG